ncbi:transketolase [Sporanaerobium hydrogeniformans]|uniref:Transketolase n=1 Tax=Sporanaerobium hydrogeniformans TaxID=3072179 RepID=A0AC61DBP4_9FIRM|nr:transketolase [Sporanaerobium hydrogeniformans]PHV70437.1 transketolase [Sporanaerobium hydrogeniformans]
MQNLRAKSFEIRKSIWNMIYKAKAGHVGGDFSVCDILVSLYYKHMNIEPDEIDSPLRDRFILSKGHSVEAYYSVLADRGFFPKEDLETFSQFKSKYIGHPNNKVNGVEMNSGSLGHGLSVGVGMAIAGKMDHLPYNVYVVMGDGELAEGSVWEGAMAAGHYKLDNLIAVIDRNRLQISGTTEEVMTQDSQEERWRSFGWHVLTTDGNNYDALDHAFKEAKKVKGKPTMIIAETTKGYGISFVEGKREWHHKVPNAEEYLKGLEELEERRRAANE